jgi:two-component system response regulator AtoC
MNERTNVLIIEAVPPMAARLKEILNQQGFTSCYIAKPDKPLDQLETLNPGLAILGPTLDTKTLLYTIHKLKTLDLTMPILSSFREICRPGEELIAAPFEGLYYLKPEPSPNEVAEVMESALRRKAESQGPPEYPIFIGQSETIKGIRQSIQKVAGKDITVLVTGESGTGKELIARAIHYHSQRKDGPLVKINCGALPDELLESEVFGFQKGAFTGAHKDKPGRLEMADRGTLFIDEIGHLSLSLQVKFLQVLEDKEFSRLGGTHDQIVDARVVAATNADLSTMVRDATFRKDLFFRLNIVNIKSPPLREIKEDIPLLTQYFVNKYCYEFGKDLLKIPEGIMKFFLAYHWPGNVRELENVIRRAIVLRDWEIITMDMKMQSPKAPAGGDVPEEGEQSHFGWGYEKIMGFFNDTDFSLKKISKAYVSEAERHAILKALAQTQWNRKKAAKLLQVSYKTLLNRIDEFELTP